MEETIKKFLNERYANDYGTPIYELFIPIVLKEIKARVGEVNLANFNEVLEINTFEDLFDNIVKFAKANNLADTIISNRKGEPLVCIHENLAALYCDTLDIRSKDEATRSH